MPDPLTIFIGIEIAASALNYKYTTSIMPHLPILTTNLKEEILENIINQNEPINKELVCELLKIKIEKLLFIWLLITEIKSNNNCIF